MCFINKQRGIIRMGVMIVVVVLFLSYIGLDIRTFIESDQTQGNLRYVWSGVVWVWDGIISPVWTRYIHPVWSYFWGFIGPTLENFGEGSLNPLDERSGVEHLRVEY